MRATLALVLLGCRPDPTPADSGPANPTRACAGVSAAVPDWDGEALRLADTPCGEVALKPRVTASGDVEVALEAVDGGWQPVLSSQSGATVTGLVLEGTWSLEGASDVVLWKQGYQSWSWSGVTAPGDAVRDANEIIEAGGDGDAFTVIAENAATSWWVGLLGRDGGASLLVGALSANTTRFYVGVDGDTLQAVWGHRGDPLTVPAGASVALDPIHLGLGADANALHIAYAELAAARAPARPLDRPPPVGWATWYQYYSDVHEDDVRANLVELAALAADPALVSPEVFQVDDGWQVRWGDWWAGEDFPSGMAPLAADIDAAGFTPGLWIAPLYVSRDSATYQGHPDWWLRDRAGEEIGFTNLGTGDYAVLDVTNADAAAWLHDTVSRIAAQGWGYLKLDFLYAGAMVGQRSADVTGIQAYALATDILRDAAGDAWILACGAPLLPSVGFADSFRTGADIAFEVSPDPDLAFYRWQARSTAARRFSHGRWWWMDPDQLIVRDPFDAVAVRGAIASGVAAGGTWMLGDDLTSLPADRLSLLLDPTLLSSLGLGGAPERPLAARSGVDAGPVVESARGEDHVPPRWTLDDGTTILLNLGETPLELDGPGGTNLLTGERAGPGPRTLAPGDGEVWSPSR